MKNDMDKKLLSEAASLIAKKGGVATLKKHGKNHYKLMAEKRWGKVKSQRAK